ncbi:Monothiol glutaredoxin-4 [Neolecta irregularis DAH-3]|uniref:Monothiol glutaredoxin-4 n=1 Tax=Neolecta irregularis (strain DAH-3) TaxID=1198029 RepID=A0A1U7LUY5_NEOID|nr:Monothiol glutaredoxin-4 [Neolecta irregularis DAH-3]|eukprot:OLL26486.1 Monothiol glutaredoxin-4 [Neolecta irregularis DAH-3]
MILHNIQDQQTFDSFCKDAEKGVAVLYFWADWAAPCKQMDQVFSELSAKHPDISFGRIEAEELGDITERFDVSAVPFFVILKNNEKVATVSGVNPIELTAALGKFSSLSTIPPAQKVDYTSSPDKDFAQGEEDLDTRLGKLVKAASVMLFMKGTPAQPQCGFSRQIIQILRDRGVRFGFFNILADDEVRQGLKEFSDWPTFPQLYIKGELVGGLDIVKEMVENGEFDELLEAVNQPSPT